MKVGGPLGHIKRTAKRIKKKHSHIPLMQVHHDLATYLGFSKWKDLIDAMDDELQERIDKKTLDKL